MFHHSTTLHHSHKQFSGFTGRENRVPYMAGKLAEWKLKTLVAWDYLNPIRKAAKLYSWAFGWPLIVKGADLGMKGLGKVADGAEWSAHTALEGVKGTYEMTAKPLWMLGWSRMVAIKRMLIDVPLATASAAIRTPIAIAKSPFEMVLGVRDAIKSVPQNAMEIFNAVRQFRLGDMLSHTRKAITDVLLPPITRPLTPVLAPAVNIAGTAFGAEWQTVSTARTAITEVIPGGFNRIRQAPATASAELAVIREERLARKMAVQKEREAKREALRAQIAEAKGEAGPGGGEKKSSKR